VPTFRLAGFWGAKRPKAHSISRLAERGRAFYEARLFSTPSTFYDRKGFASRLNIGDKTVQKIFSINFIVILAKSESKPIPSNLFFM